MRREDLSQVGEENLEANSSFLREEHLAQPFFIYAKRNYCLFDWPHLDRFLFLRLAESIDYNKVRIRQYSKKGKLPWNKKAGS